MKSPGRIAARLFSPAFSVLLLTLAAAPAPAPSAPAAELSPAPEMTTAKGETRLRKLHLVRPDLIPYPIAFEVYC